MNLDSIITVISLFVAVYAIIPRVRRLEISLKFGLAGWLFLLSTITAILYLQFYQTFRTLGLTPNLNLARWSITPQNASFIILLCTTLFFYIYLSFKGLSKSNIIKFREFVFELSREKRYSELFSLIEGNLNRLHKIYNADFILSRIHRYLERFSSIPYTTIEFNGDEFYTASDFKVSRRTHKMIASRTCSWLAKLFPTHEKEKEVAHEVVHEILLNRNTVKAVSEIRPYFALPILKKDFYENNEFIDVYLRCLADDTKSIFYHEIRNNQNLSNHGEYALPERNRLLHFLFSDCRVSEKYGPYKAIGEHVINELDKLHSQNTPDLYNEPMGDFLEDGQWESKILVGIRFFDIADSTPKCNSPVGKKGKLR